MPANKFAIAKSDPIFKKDKGLTFNVKDLGFVLEKEKLNINLCSFHKDFIIIFKPIKSGKTKCYVFHNEKYITDCNTENFDLISFTQYKDGNISNIFLNEDQNGYLANNAQNCIKF